MAVAVSGGNAVVCCESGTGEETVARRVHAAGLAPASLFVKAAAAELLGLRRTTWIERIRRLREEAARPGGRVDVGRTS